MELNRKHFRAIIFYNFRNGLTQQQCIDELNSIFGDEAPLRTSAYHQDEFREGCLVVVPETIDAVRQLILQDCHVTYREIDKIVISGTSIHSILHEPLTVKKNLFALDPTQFVNRSKKSINQSGKSASTMGSNAC